MKTVQISSKRTAGKARHFAFMLVTVLISLLAPATLAEITDASVVMYYGRRCKGTGCNIPDEGGVWISNYKTRKQKEEGEGSRHIRRKNSHQQTNADSGLKAALRPKLPRHGVGLRVPNPEAVSTSLRCEAPSTGLRHFGNMDRRQLPHW